jgi:hypothetical protein
MKEWVNRRDRSWVDLSQGRPPEFHRPQLYEIPKVVCPEWQGRTGELLSYDNILTTSIVGTPLAIPYIEEIWKDNNHAVFTFASTDAKFPIQTAIVIGFTKQEIPESDPNRQYIELFLECDPEMIPPITGDIMGTY